MKRSFQEEDQSKESEIGVKRKYYQLRGDTMQEDNLVSKRGRFESNPTTVLTDQIEEQKFCPALNDEMSSKYNQELIRRLLIEEKTEAKELAPISLKSLHRPFPQQTGDTSSTISPQSLSKLVILSAPDSKSINFMINTCQPQVLKNDNLESELNVKADGLENDRNKINYFKQIKMQQLIEAIDKESHQPS